MIDSVEMIIRQPGHPERVVRLPDGVTRLGRAEDNDVVLSDVGVSRRHARLVVTRDSVRAEDLGSGNGTYYRGFRIQNQQVEDGDELVIDPFVLQFRVKGSARKQPGELTQPVTGSPARLDVVSGGGLAKTSYPIGPRGLTIGRSETRDVVIPDPAASRHHCSILARDSQWVLRDMGSANGVFVNGVRVRESLLADGDRVRIGNTELKFCLSDATQADSTTQKVQTAGDPWANESQWTEHEVSLPVPEANTPQAPKPRRGSSAGRWVAVGGIGLVAAFVLALVGFAAAALIIAIVYGQPGRVASAPLRPPAQPVWVLQLPGGLPAADVKKLQDEGIDALKKGDNKTALQDFYRVLQGEPAKPAAERLAYAAGEYLVLEALGKELSATAEKQKAHDTQRDQLLADASRNGPVGRRAQAELEKSFRDDPVAQQKMGWGPGPQATELQAQLAKAAEQANAEKWSDAATLYEQVLDSTNDPTWRKTAFAGLKSSRRELARQTQADWRAGVTAELAGNAAEALQHYRAVLAVDPGNPSARLRVTRLGGTP